MTRLFCLSLVVVLASHVPVQAQPKDPPKYFTSSIGMKFVWIPPGTFVMGSPKGEKNRNELEVQHTVKLTKGFYIGVCAVTQEEWRDVILSTTYRKPAEGFDLINPSRFAEGKKMPLDTVSWNDCQIFLKKMGEKDKKPYRLPTEAEWEYACRAGTTTPFYCGETIATTQANYNGAVYAAGKKGANRETTTSVGSFPPNAWGLYDMQGNVAQWCQDRFGKYRQQGVDPQGPEKGGSRVLRGGSWEDAPALCRSACRAWDAPDNRGLGTFGFRACFFPE
jgi:formylglycine-generating enzyme required for sulfatase activity